MRVLVPAELRPRYARLCSVLFLWVVVAMAPTITRAQTEAEAETVAERVVLVGPFPDVLVRRIEGQLSDVPWTIVQRFDMEEHSLPRRFGIALEHEARVVVWLVETPTELTVSIGDARDQRLFERTLAVTDASRSVIYEETAVLIRSTLVALGFGAEIGRELAPEEIAPAPEPVLEPPPPVPASPPPTEAVVSPAPHAPSTSFEGALGFGVSVEGVTVPGAYGPLLRGGIVRARLVAGLSVLYAPRATRTEDGVTLALTRVEPVLYAGYTHRASARTELAFLGRGGLTVYRRSSRTTEASPFVPTPRDTHVSLLLGAELRTLVFLGRHSDAFALGLCVGLDGVLRRPRFTVGDDTTAVRFDAVLPVVPRIDVAFVVRLPREEVAR